MAGQVKRFRGSLEPLSGGLGWVVVRLPFDPKSTWKKMVRLRIKVEIGDKIFRTSLFVDSVHGGHFVLVNKQMQKAAEASLGSMIDLAVEPDLEEREVVGPPEFEKLLAKHKTLAKWYGKLSDSMRRDFSRWVDGVKAPEARQRRAEQAVERLMIAMEGEKVLPPVIELALQRNPAARKGWELMTQVQRRGHLLGTAYYQSPEAREKRVGKLVEDCLRIADSKKTIR